jgi:hypothetical protein
MYTKMLSAKEPGCIVLLIDQSGSMVEEVGGDTTKQKATECALAVNRLLRETALACQKGENFSPRCYIGLIGYGGRGVRSVFAGPLANRELVLITDVAPAPIRVASVRQKIADGAGGLVETDVPFPVWVEPEADGGTPMAEALQLATRWLRTWTQQHPTSFPPVVINVTDGEPNDARDAQGAAEALRSVETQDGKVLLLNAHISKHRAKPLSLPDSEAAVPNDFARLLFGMSSVLPDSTRRSAEAQGFPTTPASRGFVFNADVETLVRLLTFGSQPTGAR